MGKRKGTSAAKKRDRRDQRQKVLPTYRAPIYSSTDPQHTSLAGYSSRAGANQSEKGVLQFRNGVRQLPEQAEEQGVLLFL